MSFQLVIQEILKQFICLERINSISLHTKHLRLNLFKKQSSIIKNRCQNFTLDIGWVFKKPNLMSFSDYKNNRNIDLMIFNSDNDKHSDQHYNPLVGPHNCIVAFNGCAYSFPEYLTPLNDNWQAIVIHLKTERLFSGATFINDRIFILGGQNESEYLSSTEYYDPTKKIFKYSQQMSTKRMGLGVSSLYNNIYAIGGKTGNYQFNNFN